MYIMPSQISLKIFTWGRSYLFIYLVLSMPCFRLSSNVWDIQQWDNERMTQEHCVLWCSVLMGIQCSRVWLEDGAGFYNRGCLSAYMGRTLFFPLVPFTLFLFSWVAEVSFLCKRLGISVGGEKFTTPTVSLIFAFFPDSHLTWLIPGIFFLMNLFYFFIFGCVGSSLLRAGFP